MSVADYFNSVAEEYHRHYDTDFMDMSMPYPANAIRRQMLEESFRNVENPIDIGGGDGTVLEHWNGAGAGFDIAPKMVEIAKSKHGNRFLEADILDPKSYASLRQFGPFDGLIAMGVMPHIEDTRQALQNMKELVRRGKFFIEFRNSLFALFTFNKYTVELMGDLVHPDYKAEAQAALKTMLPDLPRERPYDKILSGFHNPFEIRDLFAELGFSHINTLYYHYHPTLPWLANDERFRKTALAMEGKPSWKSIFQCSAFVVEAYSG
jgi:SAM-dependent methyltransferase